MNLKTQKMRCIKGIDADFGNAWHIAPGSDYDVTIGYPQYQGTVYSEFRPGVKIYFTETKPLDDYFMPINDESLTQIRLIQEELKNYVEGIAAYLESGNDIQLSWQKSKNRLHAKIIRTKKII